MIDPLIFVCDAQMHVRVKDPIARALKARGLYLTPHLTASSMAVVCVDGDRWHEGWTRIDLLDTIGKRQHNYLIVPVILSRTGHFPNPLPPLLWERQATVLHGINDELGLSLLARAIGFQSHCARPGSSRVFICYNSADRTLALELVQDIEMSGTRTWVDRRDLQPGVRWKEVLTESIKNCSTFVLCVGAHGVSEWQLQELRMQSKSDLILALMPPVRALPTEVTDLAQSYRSVNWVPGQAPVIREFC